MGPNNCPEKQPKKKKDESIFPKPIGVKGEGDAGSRQEGEKPDFLPTLIATIANMIELCSPRPPTFHTFLLYRVCRFVLVPLYYPPSSAPPLHAVLYFLVVCMRFFCVTHVRNIGARFPHPGVPYPERRRGFLGFASLTANTPTTPPRASTGFLSYTFFVMPAISQSCRMADDLRERGDKPAFLGANLWFSFLAEFYSWWYMNRGRRRAGAQKYEQTANDYTPRKNKTNQPTRKREQRRRNRPKEIRSPRNPKQTSSR